jgi:carboxylate-amine ligase
MQDYQQLTRELIIFGCHVHIGISDRSVAISVMNRARVWLSLLLALSASSPFWLGTDTGYASYRTQIWSRWPISGPPLFFSSVAEYEALVEALVKTKSVEDAWRMLLISLLPRQQKFREVVNLINNSEVSNGN